MHVLAGLVLLLLALHAPVGAQPRADECQELCRPYAGLCRGGGKLYRLCWENLWQSCRLSSTGFPPEPTCTFPCGSDEDCGFGRRCVVQQCIVPPPGLRLTPKKICRVLCSESVFPLCEARTAHLGPPLACRRRAMRWCRDSEPDYECSSGCGTALEATGDPCVFNGDVDGTCSGGTCYERIACDSDVQCSWANGDTGTCVGGQCVPPAPPPPPPPGGGSYGFCTTFENPPCTPCDTQADCGGFDACISGSTCGFLLPTARAPRHVRRAGAS